MLLQLFSPLRVATVCPHYSRQVSNASWIPSNGTHPVSLLGNLLYMRSTAIILRPLVLYFESAIITTPIITRVCLWKSYQRWRPTTRESCIVSTKHTHARDGRCVCKVAIDKQHKTSFTQRSASRHRRHSRAHTRVFGSQRWCRRLPTSPTLRPGAPTVGTPHEAY